MLILLPLTGAASGPGTGGPEGVEHAAHLAWQRLHHEPQLQPAAQSPARHSQAGGRAVAQSYAPCGGCAERAPWTGLALTTRCVAHVCNVRARTGRSMDNSLQQIMPPSAQRGLFSDVISLGCLLPLAA